MAIRVCTGLGAAASFLAGSAMAHMAVLVPMSRQVSYSRENGKSSDFEHFETRETAYNSGGANEVRNRGKAEIDAAVQEAHGGPGAFPLIYSASAANGNMLESNELAKRHYVCGDPPNMGQGIDSYVNTYSTANRFWEPLTTYDKGQVIEMKLKVLAFHYGHVEFSICDTADEHEDSTAEQECFNKYPLTRADGDDLNSPIDPNYPGRYYVAPPCVAHENGQDVNEDYVHVERNGGHQTYSVTVRYKLPEITCTHCILQMHYFTGHVCGYPGYDEFNPSSWPSDCVPSKDDWIKNKDDYPEGGSICGATTNFDNYPQEFWNCSDIKIIEDGCGDYGGIFDDHEDGDVCCHEDCGACASDAGECKTRTGGKDDCCPYKIREKAGRCSATNPAPCIL